MVDIKTKTGMNEYFIEVLKTMFIEIRRHNISLAVNKMEPKDSKVEVIILANLLNKNIIQTKQQWLDEMYDHVNRVGCFCTFLPDEWTLVQDLINRTFDFLVCLTDGSLGYANVRIINIFDSIISDDPRVDKFINIFKTVYKESDINDK